MNARIERLTRQVDACYIPRYDMWQLDSESLEKLVHLLLEEAINVLDQDDGATHHKELLLSHFSVKSR